MYTKIRIYVTSALPLDLIIWHDGTWWQVPYEASGWAQRVAWRGFTAHLVRFSKHAHHTKLRRYLGSP